MGSWKLLKNVPYVHALTRLDDVGGETDMSFCVTTVQLDSGLRPRFEVATNAISRQNRRLNFCVLRDRVYMSSCLCTRLPLSCLVCPTLVKQCLVEETFIYIYIYF